MKKSNCKNCKHLENKNGRLICTLETEEPLWIKNVLLCDYAENKELHKSEGVVEMVKTPKQTKTVKQIMEDSFCGVRKSGDLENLSSGEIVGWVAAMTIRTYGFQVSISSTSAIEAARELVVEGKI